ncbi:MAG: transcription antitermination factor NusB [Gemmatimonadota bacterium]
MTATPARAAALRVLRGVRRGGLADRALGQAMASLEPRDRAWLQELVYGTLRLRGRLDHILAEHVRRPLEDLEPDVLDILRLGAYQLLEMGSVPPYAAVSQSVELAKEVGRGPARLVNAVLMGLSRRREPVAYPPLETDPAGHLAAWGSHPRWLVERWIERFGVEATRSLLEWNNDRPEIFLRLVGWDAADAVAALASADVEATPGPADTVRLGAGSDVAGALAVVPAVVQDPGAARVAAFAASVARGFVVDLCAAPGGKALALAQAPAVRYLLAADRSERRLRRAWDNAERISRQLGRPLSLGLAVADVRDATVADVDLALLDVPCTGTGTFRRHPDARWRVGPEDLAALVALQRDMLDAAAEVVRPGGVLVYATCSLEPEENDEQVDAFLARNPAFEPAPGCVDGDGMNETDRLVVLPQRDATDGAFAACMRRVH